MNTDLLIVLALFIAAMVLFIINKPRMDVVALLVIVALPLSGVLSIQEALAGFSDANVFLIAAMFVVGEALVRTGVTYAVGNRLVRIAGRSETRLMVLLMLAVSGLGAVMSSTGVVGVFIPVVMSVSRQMKISPARLMMPLSFAGLISGMLSLVATPPNMVLDSALKQAGHAGFSFFSFTPIGMLVLGFGIAYMLVAVRWLKGAPSEAASTTTSPRRGLRHFVREYNLENRGFRLRLLPESPLKDRRLDSLNLRREFGANVVAVERPARFGHEVLQPGARLELRSGDVLLVDFEEAIDITAFLTSMKLTRLPMRGAYFTDHSQEVGMAEVVIPPESSHIGKNTLELAFRSRHGLSIVGLRRQGRPVTSRILEEKWKMGDILLVAGPWKAIRRLQRSGNDFIVLSLPPEIEDVAPARNRMPLSIAVLAFMIVLMVGGWVPNVAAGILACLLLGLFRCVDMESAYKSIQWKSLVLIAGMIPFARAMQTTGGIDLVVEAIMSALHGAGPRMLLTCLFLLTSLTGLFISNTATAVLMAPVALSMAGHLGVSPLPFAMTVALAASAAFMTPVSSPVNTLVMGPGQYRFMDFVKVGVPFTAVVLVTTVVFVPWLFPL